MEFNLKVQLDIELLKYKHYNKLRKMKRKHLYHSNRNRWTIILGISKVILKVRSLILIANKAIKK